MLAWAGRGVRGSPTPQNLAHVTKMSDFQILCPTGLARAPPDSAFECRDQTTVPTKSIFMIRGHRGLVSRPRNQSQMPTKLILDLRGHACLVFQKSARIPAQ